MSQRLVIVGVCFALALTGAFAQTADTPKPAEAAKPAESRSAEPPPDLKAYREYSKETDPEKKVAALEKWKAEFPNSSMRNTVDREIVNTLVTKLPAQEERIRNHAASLYKSAALKDKPQTAYTLASDLLNANVLLKDAAGYAQKSVDALQWRRYLKEQNANYAKRKQKPPAAGELKKRFDASRAPRLAVLGRIEIRLGHTEKGRRLLLEANAGESANGVVQSELGVLASKAGDERKALEYLIPAKLSGRATKEAAETFAAIYRKQHDGSSEGMEVMLDAEYSRRFPNPVKLDPYTATEKRSDRMVLAEVFTGSGCPPCAAADLAFDAAMLRYPRKDLAVIMYHVHVPRPDPMTNADTQALYKAYAVNGVPTFLIDGKRTSGGGPREMTKSVYDRFGDDIQKALETPAEARMTAGASITGKSVSVHATVREVQNESEDVQELKVKIALVEKMLRYNGENGIRFHPMVVRSIQSFDLKGESYAHSFDLDAVSKAAREHLDDYEAKGHRGESFQFTEKKFEINRNELAVVVFVHDEKSKHVLQTAYVDLAGGTPPTTLEANRIR
jgi:thiol-disulfide isomerase/thioredoxin